MNLYQIDREILDCLDSETGEILDVDRLTNLHMEKNRKIENLACWIKNLKADEAAYAAEKAAFAKREQSAAKQRENLERYLADVLRGEKFQTEKCAVSFRRSIQVDITSLDDIPRDLMVEKVETKPDKVRIKELLKNGKPVSGCRLVENLNPQIK